MQVSKIIHQIADNIDAGNTYASEDELIKVCETLGFIMNPEEKLSKYQAIDFLKISRATFDNYVKKGLIPKGRDQQGFKEKFWYKKDLVKFKNSVVINRFVHSYWSKPSLKNRWELDGITQTIANMWYFATSVAYLKNLNQEIVLHTDSYGKKLLEHIPYDEVYLSLNEIPEWTDPSLFAFGKMVTMKAESINSIHINGDVFIKTEKCLEKLNNFEGDVIVQSLERASEYRTSLNAIKHIKFPNNTNRELNFAYNTGLFGFGSEEFKKLFLDVYFKMAEMISKSIRYKDASKLDAFISPDLIIEQKFMYDLSRKYNVQTLLEVSNESNSAKELGYQHVLGVHKYPQLSNCKRVLKMLNLDLYELCELKEKELTNGKIG